MTIKILRISATILMRGRGSLSMRITVLELLEEAVRECPDKIALRDNTNSITYEELQSKAKQISGYILEHNLQTRRVPIAVCIDRNIESIILFMGIVYSGNFYVPIDTTMPVDRITLILDELKPAMILSSKEQTIEDRETVSYSTIFQNQHDEKLIQEIQDTVIDTDPLYAIFTSGSTGKPKGVLVSHRSVIDLVEQFAIAFPLTEESVFGNQAPFDFDVSVKDIYNAIYQKATMVVIPKQLFSMPVKLIEYLYENKINTLIWAVSAMRIVENFKTFSKIMPDSLKLIMFSGEIMPVKVLNYWRKAIPETVFVNLYGPTEITCNCSYYIIERAFDDQESIPIGKAFRNTEVFLWNQDKKEVVIEHNVQGEICVRGTCLALGYYNAPERTNEAFVQNPLQGVYPEKIYKTGDLGFYNEVGELCFASRKDYQIKHMGHRIELGEIECVVNAIPYISAAVCVFDEEAGKIVLFYECKQDEISEFESEKSLERDIVMHLSQKLPKFMWPNRYKSYDRLPLNKNGKIDRVYLASVLKQND